MSSVPILPPEILDDIFVLCIPDNARSRQPHIRVVPHSISQVCQHWRERALSVPILWSTIYISSRQRYGWVEPWLERSGNIPLSLYFRISPYQRAHQRAHFDVLRLFCKHMRRWKHFYYACLNGAELPIDFPIIPLGGSSLEVAEIIISRHDKSWEWFRSLLECSPKLQDLSSSRMDLDTPWHVLKRARLYHRAFIHSVDCRNLLARAPQLECGRFAIPKEPGPNDTMPSTPLLHNLTQLILDTYVPVDALVDSLTLPSLKHFAVHYVHLGPSAPHFSFPNFMSFLTRSSCSLETLELTVSYHANDIITFLEHQAIRDSLKVFRLTGCFRACIDTFISSLIIPWPSDPSSAASHPAERCLVPKLETLELGPPLMTTDGILSEMVLSRMRFGLDPDMACRLKDATLHLTTEAGHEQDLAQLRLLQNTPGRDFDLKIIMNGL